MDAFSNPEMVENAKTHMVQKVPLEDTSTSKGLEHFYECILGQSSPPSKLLTLPM